MAMDPTYRPSYDSWLHQCMLFMEAAKVHARTSTTGVDIASVRIANGLEALAKPLIEMRLLEQEKHKRMPTSYNTEYVERNIGVIQDFVEANRPALEHLAQSETLMHGSSSSLLEYMDCEKSSVGHTRMTNVLSFKDMKEHADEMLARHAKRLQEQNGRG